MLNEIRVSQDTVKSFWMQKAYQVPKGITNGNEKPDSLAKKTEPIHRIAIRSVFVNPPDQSTINEDETIEIQGLAFDGGSGIAGVQISTDSGKTWLETKLDKEIGKYSWRRWRYSFTPKTSGMYYLMSRATSKSGETQPAVQWNRSGYMKNEIERLRIFVND
jgi:sulfite dehydrogenase